MTDTPFIPTPAWFVAAVEQIHAEFNDDTERHNATDEFMLDVLTMLGYGEGVELITAGTLYA